MKMNIAILGLGKIGLSIGLALGRHADQFHRSGYDPFSLPGRHTSRKEALDVIERKISNCVKDAEVIFLCLPSNKLREVLKDIAGLVRPNAIIFSTSPAKVVAYEWIQELLPEQNRFVGIEFLLPPQQKVLEDMEDSQGSSELFQNNLAAVAVPPDADTAVINLAANITRKLGAIPYYCDMLEMDGMISNTQILPQLVSSAFLNATLKSPGWRDAQKFAGQEYASISSSIAIHSDSTALSESSILMKEHILRGLDSTLGSLSELRKAISDDDKEQLEELLESARIGRQIWWEGRSNPENTGVEPSPVKMPSKGDYWKQQTGFLNMFPRKRPKDNKKG